MEGVFLLALMASGDQPSLDYSGWGGAGLLGAVLAWLLFVHLPNKDKQSAAKDELIINLIAAKDKQAGDKDVAHDVRMDGQRVEFTAVLGKMSETFKTEAAAERMACEKHFGTLAETMKGAFETVGKQLSEHSMRNQQWMETLKQELANKKAEIAEAARKRPE